MKQLKGPDIYERSLNPRNFVRTFSYRDFLTSLTLALLFWAVSDVAMYFMEAKDAVVMLIVAGMLIAPVAGHVIYKIEHRRSNNFMGRVLHDMMFFLLVSMITALKKLFSDDQPTDKTIDISIEGFIGVFFSMGLYETVIALFKRILRIFRWQVL